MLFVDCALSTSPGHVVFQRRTRVEHGLRHSSNCFRIYPHRCACADEYDGARCSVGNVVVVAGLMVDFASADDERQKLFLQLAVVEQFDLASVQLRLERFIDLALRWSRPCRDPLGFEVAPERLAGIGVAVTRTGPMPSIGGKLPHRVARIERRTPPACASARSSTERFARRPMWRYPRPRRRSSRRTCRRNRNSGAVLRRAASSAQPRSPP